MAPEPGLLNKRSCLVLALSVTKFAKMIDTILVTLLSPTLQESGDGGIFFSDDETFDVKQVQFRERDGGPLLLADDHHREVVEVFAHDRLGPDNNV
jgi:hypothetical protein